MAIRSCPDVSRYCGGGGGNEALRRSSGRRLGALALGFPGTRGPRGGELCELDVPGRMRSLEARGELAWLLWICRLSDPDSNDDRLAGLCGSGTVVGISPGSSNASGVSHVLDVDLTSSGIPWGARS